MDGILVSIKHNENVTDIYVDSIILENEIFSTIYRNNKKIVLNLDNPKLNCKISQVDLMIFAIKMETYSIKLNIGNTISYIPAKSFKVTSSLIQTYTMDKYNELYDIADFFNFQNVKKFIQDGITDPEQSRLFRCNLILESPNIIDNNIINNLCHNYLLNNTILNLKEYTRLMGKINPKFSRNDFIEVFSRKIFPTNNMFMYPLYEHEEKITRYGIIGKKRCLELYSSFTKRQFENENILVCGEFIDNIFNDKKRGKISLCVYGVESVREKIINGLKKTNYEEQLKTKIAIYDLKCETKNQALELLRSNTIQEVFFSKGEIYVSNYGLFTILLEKCV